MDFINELDIRMYYVKQRELNHIESRIIKHF